MDSSFLKGFFLCNLGKKHTSLPLEFCLRLSCWEINALSLKKAMHFVHIHSFIKWNFTKFIIDKNGQPVSRYEITSDPLVSTLVLLLKKI